MSEQRADARKNRERLLTVAARMVQTGNLAPSFNELAALAGVGVGTVYRHFPDQRALLLALLEGPLAELEAIMASCAGEPDAAKALSLMVHGIVDLELRHAALGQQLVSQDVELQTSPRFVALNENAEALLARARKARVVRASVTGSDLRRLLCGIELAARSGPEPERSARRYVDILLAGLRPSK
ncbi:TetR/AcrR family transcriptional regulator [Labilithrix luteola]|uniref:TetR/AcrR family transcriptional regulator n=1 Tax=Labilithrix luteola TaxID=1391654 RepID=UPI00147368C0|nr:TetR/AcrR family transcriptional regulator [Labilithrix luteola]